MIINVKYIYKQVYVDLQYIQMHPAFPIQNFFLGINGQKSVFFFLNDKP